ncbi:MAG: restriction endonuclease, SacI family [Aggregatilineales bacterium]
MPTPDEILDLAYLQASQHSNQLVIDNALQTQIEYVARNIQNRAGVRLLLACLLAKTHRPALNILKPYTEIGDSDSYSGRTYDEHYITAFVIKNRLPCNNTTAFLTPALRNISSALTRDTNLVGRPPRLYQTVLHILDDVQQNQVDARDVLVETIRWLILIRDEQEQRMKTLLSGLKTVEADAQLSVESIVRIIQQHLQQPRSSRLPVLAVAAAYQVTSEKLGERILPLASHNAADFQSQSLGDLEITLLDNESVITSFEMKQRRVTINDIDHALQKIQRTDSEIQNYVFITTEHIEESVLIYASSIYETTRQIEVSVLDCIEFIRYFLHIFYRLRMDYLEAYQTLVLSEASSAVSAPLKEVLLVLRQAAESRDEE